MKRYRCSVDYKYIKFGQKCTPFKFESLNNLKNKQFL